MAFQADTISRLTLGEVAAVEELSGLAMTDIGEPGVPMAKFMAAVAYVIRKRTNPDFTFADALNLRMDDLDELTAVAETPTEAIV